MSCPKCRDWYWTVCNACRGVPDEPERRPEPPRRELRTARQEHRAAGEELDRTARDLLRSGYDPNACRCGGRMRSGDERLGAPRECTRCGYIESEAG
jgi:hypothetical protein